MVDLSFLKKRSSNSIASWQKKIESDASSSEQRSFDPRFWQPKKDANGNHQSIIRFLPVSPKDAEVDPEMFPWVKVCYHRFQGPGGMYSENCLTTLGKKDPVVTDIIPMWKGTPEEKAIARQRKTITSFISNIIVIKDPANPDNEGKVFLYRYGTQVHEKILEKMFPKSEDLGASDPVNVVDFWNGANFRLKIEKNSAGFSQYTASSFLQPGPLFTDGNDKEIEKIWSQQHALLPFVDPSNFKSFEELKARYLEVLSVPASATTPTPTPIKEKTPGLPPTKNLKVDVEALVEEAKPSSSLVDSLENTINVDDEIDKLFA